MLFFSRLFWAILSTVSTCTQSVRVDGVAPHPRLILTPDRLRVVKAFISNNTQAASYFSDLKAQGEYVLGTTPFPRPPLNDSSILMQARTVLTRTYVSSLLYQLTGNVSYARRALAELTEIVTWSNWNIQSHALDAGELAHAAAVAFDWCYDAATPAERSSLAAGIVETGLLPFRGAFASRI